MLKLFTSNMQFTIHAFVVAIHVRQNTCTYNILSYTAYMYMYVG